MNATSKTMKNELCVMDGNGDTKYIWNVDNEDEIEAARDIFNNLKQKNFIAYTVKGNGKKGEVIKRFDETLGKIIMIPPVVGG